MPAPKKRQKQKEEPTGFRSVHAKRLYWLLDDLGYSISGRIDVGHAARVIARRAHRSDFRKERLLQLLEGFRLSAEEAVVIATGLGIDVREILYDDGGDPAGEPPARQSPG